MSESRKRKPRPHSEAQRGGTRSGERRPAARPDSREPVRRTRTNSHPRRMPPEAARARNAAQRKRAKKRRRRESAGRIMLNWLIALTLALLLGFICKTFVFEMIAVKGDAMYATLGEGEVVMVTKYDYWSEAPARGDIVAVSVSDGIVLRRVVGLPGERIAIENGETVIDGQVIVEPYIGLRTYDNYAEVNIPSGRFFVMSDNRTVTYDSRSADVDLINKNRIIGKARTVVWPLNRLGGGL